MKKTLLLLWALIFFAAFANSQTTYYWVGGNGTQTTTGTTAIAWVPTSWNTALDGTGSQRTVSSNTDILVFDGNAPNLTSKNIYIKDMPNDSTGQLKLINGAIVSVLTLAPIVASNGTVAFGAAYGGVTVPVTGTGTNFTTTFRKGDYIYTTGYTNMAEVLSVSSDVDLTTAADPSVAQVAGVYYKAIALYIKGNPGLTIDAGCTLGFGITLSSSSQLGAFVLAIQPGATGLVNGNFSFLSRGNGARLIAHDPGSLVFASGSNCNVSISGGKFYMMGNTCGTGSAAAATFAFNTGAPATVFQAGSNYRQGTLQANTPFGVSHVATTPLVFSPAVSFLPLSNYYFTYTNGYQPYFFGNGASFGNIIWNSTATPGSSSATAFSFNPARVDTLQILAMGTPASSTNGGRIVLYGDYINNSATTCNFGTIIFAGSSLQKISGTNTTAPAGTIIVNDQANVQLQKNITVTGAVNNLGKLDVGNFTVTGSGTPAFTNASAFNKTYDKAAGVGNLNSMCAAVAGSKNVTVSGISVIPVGTTVTCSSHPGLIPAGTFVVSYSGSGVYVLSKAATASADSTSTPALSLTFVNAAGTVTTSNTAGLDGSFPAFTTFNLNAGAGYTFGAATTAPFPASVASPINAGNVTVNAATTLNKAILNIAGTLTLNTGILTVPTGDSIKLSSGLAIAGSPFSNTKFIDTKVDAGTGARGVLYMEKFSASTLFPVGTNGNYLPVTIAPDSVSGFAVTAFNGATVDGTPNGAALAAGQKDTSVDANYIVNRVYPNNDNVHSATLTFGYPSSLGGTTFNTYINQIGISHYNGATWDVATGSGSNSSFSASATFSSFSPFYITHNTNVPLPVRLGTVSAIVVAGGQVRVSWKVLTEINADKYIVERSSNGVSFSTAATVFAAGQTAYIAIDASPVPGVNYYRIKAFDKDGKSVYSSIVSINVSGGKNDLNVYPNPVRGSVLNVQFANMQKGKVSVSLYNKNGQQVTVNMVEYSGGVYSQALDLPVGLASGVYQLVIGDGKKSTQQPVVILP